MPLTEPSAIPDVPYGYYRCAEDGRLLAANTAFAQLLGYDSVARLLAQDINLDRAWYVDPVQCAALRHDLQRREKVLDRVVEVRRLARGDMLWVAEDVLRRPSPDGGHVIEGFVRDVSEQRREQQRLHRQADRFRAFDALLEAWYWETDQEHRFTYVSPSAERIVALPRQRYLGARPWELAQDPDEAVWTIYRQDVEARRPFSDFHHPGADGAPLISAGQPMYDDDGGFVGYRGSTRAASQGAASNEVGNGGNGAQPVVEMVAGSTIPMMVHRGGPLLHVNEAMAEMLGYANAAELLANNANIFDLFVPTERDRLRALMQRRLQGQGAPPRYETQMRRADGDEVWVISIASLLPWRGEQAVLAAMVDITAYKRGEDELRAAIAEAERASRAKSDFLAAMSHELRTPLNAIMGFSEVIENELLGPVGTALYRDYASDIHNSGRHLLSLISDLLDIARIEAGRLELHEEHIVVPELVDEVLTLVRKDADAKGLDLQYNLGDGLPLLYADHRASRQMLLNLLSNAIKFTPKGGEVRLCATFDDSSLQLEVRDTGVGVAPEELPKILTLFGQAENSRIAKEGTGLGLPITKSLIEQHGGRLDIDTARGRGMRATLVFPFDRLRRAAL